VCLRIADRIRLRSRGFGRVGCAGLVRSRNFPFRNRCGRALIHRGPACPDGSHAGRMSKLASVKPGAPRAVIIRTLGLEKSYGTGEAATYALRGVDSVIYRGELIAVMGPSGSGKSTYFNMIGGLDSATRGRILIDEVDVAQLSAVELAFLRCQKIGY